MAINTIPISRRTLPWDAQITAAGGYTMPKHVHIPHASLQVLSSGHVPHPPTGFVPTEYITPSQTAGRPVPGWLGSGVHGIRSIVYKGSPGS